MNERRMTCINDCTRSECCVLIRITMGRGGEGDSVAMDTLSRGVPKEEWDITRYGYRQDDGCYKVQHPEN